MTRGRIAVAAMAAVAFGVVASLALASGSHGRNGSVGAKLTGYNEVPSNIVDGQARFTAQIASDKITFKLEYTGLTGNPSQAHIHIGQKFAANGGVSGWICGGGGQPACPAATSGTITGTITGANVTGPAAQGVNPGDLAGLLKAIKHHVAYANMHTAKFPAGEIRGQLGGGFRHDDDDD
jgi:hypothetical protein